MNTEPWIEQHEYPTETPRLTPACRVHYALTSILIWCSLALHAFSTYEAVGLIGGKAAIGTFCLPVFSEIYWCVRFWQSLGPLNVVNLGLLVIGLCCFGLLWMPVRFDIITPKFMHYKHWKGHTGEFRRRAPKKKHPKS